MIPWTALLFGLGLSAVIVLVAYRRCSLTRSGAAGALVVGALLFAFGGPAAGVLLIAFFVSSTALSRVRSDAKRSLAEKFSKGSERDLAQVLANSGVAALLAAAYFYARADWLWGGMVGALASVNADTWSTELGVLAARPPRLITNGRMVEVGASGGVTARGTLAALAGALLIALLAGVFWVAGGRSAQPALGLAAAGTLGGLAGALFDSVLGATVQSIYFCAVCEKETERHPLHSCGAPTRLVRGWAWLDNDWVNFLSSGVGAGLAAAVLDLAT